MKINFVVNRDATFITAKKMLSLKGDKKIPYTLAKDLILAGRKVNFLLSRKAISNILVKWKLDQIANQ